MRTFHATDPVSGEPLPDAWTVSSESDLHRICTAAAEAFPSYQTSDGPRRHAFLNAIANELEARREAIVQVAGRESGLPDARLNGELSRTTGQLRMFAALVQSDAWREPRIDHADPNRTPAPKPDVRSLKRAIGPVAVFGAANFPLAFSTAGGDTASALAAGCPVVVKAHPSHPGTSAAVAEGIVAAVRSQGLPDGVFGVLYDDGHEIGAALVADPRIRAVGFTGSRRGGEALMRIAAARPVPIPVYAEMGSVNPVFVLPAAARQRAEAIAEGLHGSFTLGTGQFCTGPGVVLLPAGTDGDRLRDALAAKTAATPTGTMLNAGICNAYRRGLERLRTAGGRQIASGPEADGTATPGVAAVWEADLAAVQKSPDLLAEVFGPSTLLLRYPQVSDLPAFITRMEGQLTATLQADEADLQAAGELVELLADRVGRVIWNEWPTGVEVGPAMVHGGPYPATSDGRSTSVGTHAIDRFARLVAYQNLPAALLPPALREG